MKRLAIITTHPIQYNAPLFELIARRSVIEIKVFYTWGISVLENKFDPGFGKVIKWDIPLLHGYNYTFLENVSVEKGSHHFKGIVNPAIIQEVESFKPDAVLVYGWSFVSHLKVLRYFKNKIPVLFRGDSNLLDNTSLIKNIARKIVLKFIYRHVDIALYVGKANYDYFLKAGIKKNELIFAPHAIDNDRFGCNSTNCKQTASAFRSNFKIGTTDFVFLFAGKLEPKKDPGLLLEAFMNAGFKDNVHIILTGNGILEQPLKEQYGKKCNIHFLDFQNQLQMPALYEMANVFVLPSKGPGETWGLAVNEAMANGKPVIVSDKCGCAYDLVENEINGFIFRSGDVADLKNKLKRLYEAGNNIKQMGIASKNKIRQYSLEHLADSIEQIMINKKVVALSNGMTV